ncbi:hypothetical protein CN601_01010 [Bacillus sp. AFS017336]|nr:hypothetical protein CN601_01010 [Bacillus sp. AFS017336]
MRKVGFYFYHTWAYDLEGLTLGTRQYIYLKKEGSQSQGSLGFDFFFFFKKSLGYVKIFFM